MYLLNRTRKLQDRVLVILKVMLRFTGGDRIHDSEFIDSQSVTMTVFLVGVT